MKRLVLFLSAAIITAIGYAKDIQELVVTTNPPMSCQNCEKKIKNNLRFEKGVKAIETNIPDQRVIIEYDADKTSPAQIEEAFQKIGYQVEVIEPQPQNNVSPEVCPETGGNCCTTGSNT